MHYHTHLVKSTSLNTTKNICKHARKREYIFIITKDLKMAMELILKQAYLGRAVKTLHQSLTVIHVFCARTRNEYQISHK